MPPDMGGGNAPEFESDSPAFPTRRWAWKDSEGVQHKVPSTGQITVCRAGVPVDRMQIIDCHQCDTKIAIQRTCLEDLIGILDALGWGVWDEEPGEMICPCCLIEEFNACMDRLRDGEEEEEDPQ